MRKKVVGIMGPGAGADRRELDYARALGRGVAEHGWILLTGGQGHGVMHAASQAAHKAGGTVLGILPQDSDGAASEWLDIAVVTGLGSARNNVNILSSDVLIACGMGLGTASEVALALKAGKAVVLLGAGDAAETLFNALAPASLHVADTPDNAIATASRLLGPHGGRR